LSCAPGCVDTWVGDGMCDEACRVPACRDDGFDCGGACKVTEKYTDLLRFHC